MIWQSIGELVETTRSHRITGARHQTAVANVTPSTDKRIETSKRIERASVHPHSPEDAVASS